MRILLHHLYYQRQCSKWNVSRNGKLIQNIEAYDNIDVGTKRLIINNKIY